MFIFFFISLCAFSFSNSHAQNLISVDSIKYQESSATFYTSLYNDLYLNIHNSASDSTITVYVFSLDAESNSTPVSFVDLAGSNIYTLISSISMTSNSRKKIFIPGGHEKLKVLYSPGEGTTALIYLRLTAFQKLQF